MKLASFSVKGPSTPTHTWGIIDEEKAYDIGAKLKAQYTDLKAMIRSQAFAEAQAAMPAANAYPLAEIDWLPVIPNPDKIFCVGLNYETHRKETGRAVVSHPTIFTRFADSQTAHLKPIVRPRVSTDLDFEGELAVIIGRPGRYLARDRALDHVAGYACYNDGSIRDWQHHTHQFTPGKNFPQTGSFGPWMVTPDELDDLRGLRISTRLNGETVQDTLLGQMIFDVPTIIEYCSSFSPLASGDVILTGTPGGVGSEAHAALVDETGRYS